jgi:hypothetical protein
LPWLSGVRTHRNLFSDSIFRFTVGDHVRHEKFVYALQSPLLVCFLRVTHIVPGPTEVQPSEYEVGRMDTWLAEFELSGEYSYTDDGGYPPEGEVVVLADCLNLGGNRCASDSEWKPLTYYVELVPDEDERCAPAERRRRPDEATLLENPWLLDFLSEQGRGGESTSDGRDARAGGPRIDAVLVGLDNEAALDAEEVFDALHARRMAWSGDGHPRERPFAWAVLGGRWTAAHRGVAFDAFQGKTMSSDARTFVGMPMMQQTCRWSLSLYGEYACFVLATCWVSKMTYLFALWVDAGSSGGLKASSLAWSA